MEINPQSAASSAIPPQRKTEKPGQAHSLRRALVLRQGDSFSPALLSTIEEAWNHLPEIREEVMDDARRLANQKDYPNPSQRAALSRLLWERLSSSSEST